MSDAIYALLIAKPIGSAPAMSLVKTPNEDGTVDVKTSVTGQTPVTLDQSLARTIADAVANGVCAQLISAAVVTTPDPVSGALLGKIS
jgi:hypothetical protein